MNYLRLFSKTFYPQKSIDSDLKEGNNLLTFMIMTIERNEVLDIFEKSGALLKGHFILRSGLRSEYYFQCARIGEDLGKITRLAELLIQKIGKIDCQTIIAPAMGALVIGQEIARQMGKRFIFPEKVDGKLELRRFSIKPGEKILVVEDVVTQGGRAQETLEIVKKAGGKLVGIAILVDRSASDTKFEVPLYSLIELSFPTYKPEELPAHLKAIPPTKPGS